MNQKVLATLSFNPRTRVGCDHHIYRLWQRFAFQSTHPCGVRPAERAKAKANLVSIHAPVWGATRQGNRTSLTYEFQSTHPCGVRPSVRVRLCLPNMFQSTHPCGVRQGWCCFGALSNCFNPRTRVGCDNQPQRTQTGERFQSTHPCGVRRFCPIGLPAQFVSIHAPVWGATVSIKYIDFITEFQSTHPCGVRPATESKKGRKPSFNPRTRVGCDKPLDMSGKDAMVSIHAPVWGATSEKWKI